MSQFLSVSFDHAHPSADEIRIAAFRCAMDAGEKGVCLVQAKIQDQAAPINVVVNIAAGEATVVLSLPKRIQSFPFGCASRTVEGAAAAAMFLHRDLEHGTMEVTVGQPGGILEIGMRKESGEVTGLSAGGPVEVSV